MSEISDEQFKEIREACFSSYQRGYREGYIDACKQIRKMVDDINEAAKEIRDFWGDEENEELP